MDLRRKFTCGYPKSELKFKRVITGGKGMIEFLLNLDGSILLWIQENLRADWLTPFMIAFTKLGGLGLIWIVTSLIFLCFKKTRWVGAAGLLALFFSLAVNNVCLKRLIARTRPYEVVEGLQLLTKKASDFSFPSGHTGSSFAAATAFFLTIGKGKARWIAIAAAALMAYTRLYIGIHYPTDILGGLITGCLCGYAAYRIICAVRTKWIQTAAK